MARERRGNSQPKLPFMEPVVTTSLVTGRTEARIRRRKRRPGAESDFEMVQRADIWWVEKGRLPFHQYLKAWANVQSDLLREVGESTPLAGDNMDEAQASSVFNEALVDAKKQRINPWEIVKRFKRYGTLLEQRNLPEAVILLDEYYVKIVDLMEEVFLLTSSRKETFLAFLRYQKTLPHFS